MIRLRALALIACTALLALAGCGSGEESADVPQVELQPETIDELPKLPRGYEAEVSPVNGLAFGRPPGWAMRGRGVATLLVAPDRLVVMSLSADRTNEALAAEPRTLATRTFSALSGYEGELDPSEPQRFRHPYESFQVRGTGIAADTGVRQRLRVIVLRRDRVAVVTAVIAENAERDARAQVDQAVRALRTLRTRPVG